MKEKDPDSFYHLLTLSGFRDWVQKPNDESNYFWKKWMENHPEKISDVKKAREFIERLNFHKAQLSSNELDDMLGKIIAHEKPADRKRKGKGMDFSQWYRIAAVLLISFIAAVLLFEFVPDNTEEAAPVPVARITLENPKGRKSKITLPDGTKVDLNYESRLKFPKTFEGELRKVELTGEAFFEVAHNDTMPFVIQTSGLVTEVLGTSFNIKSIEGEQETAVSLVSGMVKVSNINEGTANQDRYISPGEQLSYNRNSGQMKVSNFDVERITAWKEGIILLKDAGFMEFIDLLEGWYGVDFQVHGTPSKNWKINGRYQNESLNDILTGLKFVYGFEYQIQGKKVVLTFK